MTISSDMEEDGEWEGTQIDVETTDLCEVYGCKHCPGKVSQDGQTLLCTHFCHLSKGDA